MDVRLRYVVYTILRRLIPVAYAFIRSRSPPATMVARMPYVPPLSHSLTTISYCLWQGTLMYVIIIIILAGSACLQKSNISS